MLNKIKIAIILGLAVFAVGSAEAAFNTDIIGQTAITSFEAIVELLPAAPDETSGTWVLTAPDGSARFAWRRDASDARLYDAWIWFDAKPFADAGLDVSKLPVGMVSGDEIVLGTKLSKEPLVYDGEVSPVASFAQIVKLDRESIGYHAALDHYGITFVEGTLFEWAKDVSTNDKDIVFVLNPQIFIDAGVDPSKVRGWTFAKVPVEDARGRKLDADKFLKPFDLK